MLTMSEKAQKVFSAFEQASEQYLAEDKKLTAAKLDEANALLSDKQRALLFDIITRRPTTA